MVKLLQKDDAESMNNFIKGMSSIGQLYPPAIPPSEYPDQNSAWEGVATAFKQAGDSLRIALEESLDGEPKKN